MLSRMRLFTGLAIPEHLIAPLETVMNLLRGTAPLRWSPVENLHITTKFIGEWPEARLAELQEALAKMPKPGVFEMSVGRFGFLPNPHRPKIFFAGVHGGAGLGELATKMEDTVANLGVKREERPYTPHLTLARIGNESIVGLREKIAELTRSGANLDFGAFTAKEFHLYLSKSGPGGSVYSRLAAYSLEKAAS